MPLYLGVSALVLLVAGLRIRVPQAVKRWPGPPLTRY